jgi:hypothetical protein
VTEPGAFPSHAQFWVWPTHHAITIFSCKVIWHASEAHWSI